MTTLQINSLLQVKKLLDYGGALNLQKGNYIMTIAYDYNDDIAYNIYNHAEKNMDSNYVILNKSDLHGFAFHSWLIAPPLKEGEEVWYQSDVGPITVKGIVLSVYGVGVFQPKRSLFEFSSHYAVPCRLLEEEKECEHSFTDSHCMRCGKRRSTIEKDIREVWAGSGYVDELEGQSQGEINMILGNKIDDLAKAVNKLTILSKKNNQ
jgi:hypothetical protein